MITNKSLLSAETVLDKKVARMHVHTHTTMHTSVPHNAQSQASLGHVGQDCRATSQHVNYYA